MRCPKCHYISFESGERCRNCGYDFSLTAEAKTLDLPIKSGADEDGPLVELPLAEPQQAHRAMRPEAASRGAAAVATPPVDAPAAQRQFSAAALDLPLFSRGDPDDDRPLVTPPAVPRPPLAVRRGSPAGVRSRPRDLSDGEEAALALHEGENAPRAERFRERQRRMAPEQVRDGSGIAEHYVTASLIRRAFGGMVDAVIILGIDAAIVYLTLRLCGLRVDQLLSVPVVPFLTFVLLLNGGYFSAFIAAGGQTIGKMAAGTRVVPQPAVEGRSVSFGYAVVRAAAYLVSVLPAGIGLIPALLSAERRTLHDRLAETRVVRS